MLKDAIEYYHSLLTDEVAEEADRLMRLKLEEKSLYFGARPLCVVLRPHLYTEADWSFMKTGLERLLSAFARAHELCRTNADLRAQLYLDEYEEALIPYDRVGVPPWTSSRLDTFYIPEQRALRCVEYNAETPAGIGYDSVLCEVFDELEPVKRFQERYNVRTIRSLDTLCNALLDGYRAWGGNHEKPHIAILDWREVPTLNEHEITRQYLEQQGYKSILADPRLLEYRDGSLWHENFRIDMIYKRVLYSELIDSMGMDSPVLRAMRDGKVYITNSISAKMMAKKASLAFLSDERNASLFNQSQLEAIHKFVPWTRVIEERKTLYQGEEVDLIDFVNRHKDRFALKPNDDYGGSGVVLGWAASSGAWEAAVNNSLIHPHVIQERVNITEVNFPMWINGQLDISPRYVDADPYIFSGDAVGGVLTRLSPSALLNVTAGGGSVVPTLIISDKT